MPNRFFFLMLFFWIPAALALTAEATLPDAAQEARARALFHEIRCVVCQSEAIYDSPADVAADMRRLVREQVALGASDADIKSYLVSRYGDVILMKPPFNKATLLLWLGPLLFIFIGGWVAWRALFPSPLVGEGGAKRRERGKSLHTPPSNMLKDTPLPNPLPQGEREL